MKEDSRQKKVVFVDEKVKTDFESLKSGKSENLHLYEFIDRAFDDLKNNPCSGIKIPKSLWPKEYIKKYGIKNLWKYDLPNGWRLIYTIKGNEVEVISIILEWFNHKDYCKKFNYKSN
ncbi:MAG: type II toxin-antitoxin system RelE/ParE family toxin [Candidatus Diapherotrites archaeon]|nr:type II toxin-antitoxin system RelE/ParE family toxin [Candidatus Diapherotrites archaeon]